MVLLVHEKTGLPFVEGLDSCVDLPHTLSNAIAYKSKLDSIFGMPKDKRPPRGIWDKSYALDEFLDTVWDDDKNKKTSNSYEFDEGDVE